MSNGDYFIHSADADVADPPFHYRRCGLDNIFLINGFEIEEDDEGERYTTVLDVDGLHKAIGLHLVTQRKVLSPKEIRFLRRTLDLTQAELGRLINQSVQQIARWEKGENNISGPADRLLRLMFVGQLVRDGVVEMPIEFLNRIDEMDDTEDDELTLCRAGEDWLEAA